MTVLDTKGNRTFVAFSLGGPKLAAAQGESPASYSGPSDKFSAQLKFHMEDFYPLEKAELLDSNGVLLRTDALPTTPADITYSFPDLFGTEGFTRDFTLNPARSDYSVKLYNKEGHVREQAFTLAGARQWFFGPSEWFSSGGILDLYDGTGFLPGVLGRVVPLAPTLGLGVNPAVVSGPLVNLQQAGSYISSVLTGNDPALADGVEKTLGIRNYYYSVWNAFYPLPQGCVSEKSQEFIQQCQNGTLTPEQCTGGVVCHTDTIVPPTELKRYNRLKLTAVPAEFTGVFKYLCDTEDAGGTNCVAGRHPELTGLLTLAMEGWGVAYSGGPGLVSGGLSAWVPAGANVTVKLADWLSLTFENVTTAGQVNVSLMDIPSLPGVRALWTLTIQGAGLAYTGNMRVALKYDPAGLTTGQISFMEALKINNTAARDYEKRPILDKSGNIAVFNAASFGNYMLEVPSYPTPYSFASSNPIGAVPELAFIAGETFSAAPVQGGSPAEQDLFGILSGRGLMPAGNAYVIGPTGQKFAQAASITMAYDKAAIPALKLRENTLAIYQVSEDGVYLSRLGNSVLNTAKGEITAEVPELHSLFVIAGI